VSYASGCSSSASSVARTPARSLGGFVPRLFQQRVETLLLDHRIETRSTDCPSPPAIAHAVPHQRIREFESVCRPSRATSLRSVIRGMSFLCSDLRMFGLNQSMSIACCLTHSRLGFTASFTDRGNWLEFMVDGPPRRSELFNQTSSLGWWSGPRCAAATTRHRIRFRPTPTAATPPHRPDRACSREAPPTVVALTASLPAWPATRETPSTSLRLRAASSPSVSALWRDWRSLFPQPSSVRPPPR